MVRSLTGKQNKVFVYFFHPRSKYQPIFSEYAPPLVSETEIMYKKWLKLQEKKQKLYQICLLCYGNRKELFLIG